MPKPVSEWTEDDVLALPLENDSFERKGAHKLDLTIPRVSEDEVLNELAKQLSAFANLGGGQIIYGVANSGAVDNGGIARVLKGRQSTKEWLEDVIPTLTDPEITGFNIYEILPNASGSAIAADRSLYVVDVPDSERSPHQSKRDWIYYVRLAGKSRPAPHRLIEDIRNRARHPKLETVGLRLINATYIADRNTGFASVHMMLEVTVWNVGRIRAANTALLLAGNVDFNTSSPDTYEYLRRIGSRPGTLLFDLKHGLYPEMDLAVTVPLIAGAQIQPPTSDNLEGALLIGGRHITDVTITSTWFADSAPPRKQAFTLAAVDRDEKLKAMLRQQVRRLR